MDRNNGHKESTPLTLPRGKHINWPQGWSVWSDQPINPGLPNVSSVNFTGTGERPRPMGFLSSRFRSPSASWLKQSDCVFVWFGYWDPSSANDLLDKWDAIKMLAVFLEVEEPSLMDVRDLIFPIFQMGDDIIASVYNEIIIIPKKSDIRPIEEMRLLMPHVEYWEGGEDL
jgi:hypothetical protein